MWASAEVFEENWLNCDKYESSTFKKESCNILNRIHKFIFENPIETGSIFDNWLMKVTILLFVGFIITSLYTAFTEKPKVLFKIL